MGERLKRTEHNQRKGTLGSSWKIGAMRMPARPTRIMVNTHDRADERSGLIPRSPLSSWRSTVARISSPMRV